MNIKDFNLEGYSRKDIIRFRTDLKFCMKELAEVRQMRMVIDEKIWAIEDKLVKLGIISREDTFDG